MPEEKAMFVPKGRQRSFGRTSSRLSQEELKKLDDRIAPFAMHVTDNIPINLEELFPNHTSNSKLIVELGIGNGLLLANRATHHHENRHIGVEVYKNGLQTLVIETEKQKLENLRICNDDARRVLENLPENSVDELVILYPDPWPKKKHNKRRIIQLDLLQMADRVIKTNGTLFIATDIPDYMMWILREIYNHDVFFPTAISPEEWAKAPDWWIETKYEKKATLAGRKPWYIEFKRNVDKSNTKCEAL